jgi:hypothetical protein
MPGHLHSLSVRFSSSIQTHTQSPKLLAHIRTQEKGTDYTHGIKKHDPNRILRPHYNLLLLYLHSSFQSSIEMGSLEILVRGVIVEALHGGGTVYAEEDDVAFGVKGLRRG